MVKIDRIRDFDSSFHHMVGSYRFLFFEWVNDVSGVNICFRSVENEKR